MVDTVAPRRGEAIVNPDGTPTNRHFAYLESMTTQTNETVSDTEIDASSINLSSGKIGENARNIKDIENLLMPGLDPQLSHLLSKDFKVAEYSANHTVTMNEVVICTAAITVTLTANFIGQRVYIKRTSGRVTIAGSVDGEMTTILRTNNAAVTLVYTGSGWWIV